MRNTLKTTVAVVALAAGAFAAQPANAAFFQNSTGIASPAQTITFSEVAVPTGSTVTTQYSGLGVTFTPNVFAFSPAPPFPHVSDTVIGNFNGASGITPTSIHFNSAQSNVGFAFLTNTGTTTFTALLNGNQVDTGTAATDFTSTNNFFGFTGVTFDEIKFVVTSNNGAYLLDNVQLGTASAVPEPSPSAALGFGALGLAALAFASRKRGNRTA